MTDIPPSRWKVVERGRRLVVIDMATGQEASRMPGAAGLPGDLERGALAKPPARFGGVEKLRFDGGGTLTTHPLYDRRAPRTIRLDAASAMTLGRVRMGAALVAAAFGIVAVVQPLVLVAIPFILLQPKLRADVRQRITLWLDARAADPA